MGAHNNTELANLEALPKKDSSLMYASSVIAHSIGGSWVGRAYLSDLSRYVTHGKAQKLPILLEGGSREPIWVA